MKTWLFALAALVLALQLNVANASESKKEVKKETKVEETSVQTDASKEEGKAEEHKAH